MGKLIKYELRKNRTLLLVMLGVIVAIEGYFLISIASGSDRHVLISTVLMPVVGFAAAAMVFYVGISSYSQELRQKTSYMVFMTPHSSSAIIAAKLLFTLVLGVAVSVFFAALFFIDWPLFARHFSDEFEQYATVTDLFNSLLQMLGTNSTSLLLTVAFTALSIFANLISVVSLAYLAITLSSTLLQNKGSRTIVAVLIFIALQYFFSWLSNQWHSADDLLQLESTAQMIRLQLPVLIQSVLVVALSIFGCGWLLDRYVSL